MRILKTNIVYAWRVLLFSIAIGPNVCAEEEFKEMIQGSGYVTARYIGLGMNDASATIYDPGVFEGQKTIEFGNGSGFSLAGGFLREGKQFFGGLELEWIMNSTDIVDPLPSSLFEDANSFDQLSLNLNTVFGANLFHRKFRPYVFGGIGYTEAQLIGHYGLATVDRGDESWDSTFGYHAGIGADVQLYKNLYLDAGCRYYATTDPRLGNSESWIEIPNSGYILHIGLAYNHLFPPQEKIAQRNLEGCAEDWKMKNITTASGHRSCTKHMPEQVRYETANRTISPDACPHRLASGFVPVSTEETGE